MHEGWQIFSFKYNAYCHVIFCVALFQDFYAARIPFTAVPPDCLLDRSLGNHEYVTANGIKFHYVTAGDRSKPLMLFLHGFPEVSMPMFLPSYTVTLSSSRSPLKNWE